MIGEALVNLSDIANCVGGDFHTMHLNISGEEFDTIHGILKKYYEEADEDYDLWAEAALMFEDIPAVSDKNLSATRINWQGCSTAIVDRSIVITEVDRILESYLNAMSIVYLAAEQNDTDYKCIAILNTIHDRIEYWTKEKCYFNKRRVV
jgi:DNA-binding ferritin-like protein